LRIDVFQKRLGLAEVRGLAWGQGEGDRIAQSIDKGVDFGGQSTPGTSDGLVAAVFFRAPALCW
jgi:ABC-type phosphate transport system substrate-binding protein